ncbi:MAG: dihydrofolate reductase [Alphaproteobacteria bacterium]|nr:dihydrofolate reductase [Alphaproteobacteria bacterium]
MNRRVHLFIAASLDGYIAGLNDDVDWLFHDQDYTYGEFIRSIDTILMGRRTYEVATRLGDWPADKKSIVFTRGHPAVTTPDTTTTADPPATVVAALKASAGRDLWLMGGGDLIRSFLAARLIDDVTVAVHPVILGSGIPLIPPGSPRTSLRLLGEQRYDSGLLLVRYAVAG